MAAAYPNNALYTSEVSEPRGAFPHSRNLSTVSSATLHTSTTLHSPPTEPLLPPSAPGTEAYYEVLSRQSRGASRSSVHLRWDQNTTVDGTPPKGESRGLWNRVVQVKLSRWKWLKAGLEAVIGEPSILRQSAWAIGTSGIMRYRALRSLSSSEFFAVAASPLVVCCGRVFWSLRDPCANFVHRNLVAIQYHPLFLCVHDLRIPCWAVILFSFGHKHRAFVCLSSVRRHPCLG